LKTSSKIDVIRSLESLTLVLPISILHLPKAVDCGGRLVNEWVYAAFVG